MLASFKILTKNTIFLNSVNFREIMKRITKDKSNKNKSESKSRITTRSQRSEVEVFKDTKNVVKDTKKAARTGKKKVEVEKLGIELIKNTANTKIDNIEACQSNVTIKTEPKDEIIDSESSPTAKIKREHISIGSDEISSVKKEENDEKKIKWEPLNWERVLENLREMRKNFDAPVDEMGCDKCADDEAPATVIRFHSLVSLMLSSQTKDQVTHAAMLRLREHGLTVENVLNTPDEKLEKLIYPASFFKNKAKYIKRTCEILQRDYGSDIPNTIEGLCKLPGVGPKMAHLCMNSAWGQVTGIGVDTHVHRISNRLGWVRNTKTPEHTRKELEDWLPHDLWSEVNHLLVGFGQQICQPLRPQCATCLNHEICPFGANYLEEQLVKASKKNIKKRKS